MEEDLNLLENERRSKYLGKLEDKQNSIPSLFKTFLGIGSSIRFSSNFPAFCLFWEKCLIPGIKFTQNQKKFTQAASEKNVMTGPPFSPHYLTGQSCPWAQKLCGWLMRGWRRCSKVTLQKIVPTFFRWWGDEWHCQARADREREPPSAVTELCDYCWKHVFSSIVDRKILNDALYIKWDEVDFQTNENVLTKCVMRNQQWCI